MTQDLDLTFVAKRAYNALIEQNAALQSQLGQAHEQLLLAQADAETLRHKIRAFLLARPGSEEAIALKVDLRRLAREAHPGAALADEVLAARAELARINGRLDDVLVAARAAYDATRRGVE